MDNSMLLKCVGFFKTLILKQSFGKPKKLVKTIYESSYAYSKKQ